MIFNKANILEMLYLLKKDAIFIYFKSEKKKKKMLKKLDHLIESIENDEYEDVMDIDWLIQYYESGDFE